jgi:hypothetical protein
MLFEKLEQRLARQSGEVCRDEGDDGNDPLGTGREERWMSEALSRSNDAGHDLGSVDVGLDGLYLTFQDEPEVRCGIPLPPHEPARLAVMVVEAREERLQFGVGDILER